MALQKLPETNSFIVSFEDTIASSQDRANAIAAMCDQELAVLMSWFGISNAFGPSDRIQVFLDKPAGSGAVNFGYQSGGQSNIHMNAVGVSNSDTDANGREVVKMIFVNELVEVLMGWNRQNAKGQWNAGDSSGEALSQLCGILRYGQGHYLFYPSFVNSWLQTADRHDWVSSAPENTDKNKVSFGCALLFLFYLTSQLGFSIEAIIAAGSNTLEGVYQNLNGTNDDPFLAFSRVLRRYLPGTSTITKGNLDNPFPLHDPILTTPGILWHNSSTGGIQVWYMNGGRVASRATVLGEDGNPTFIGPPFSIAGTNDFNEDDTADILWHNSTTHETQLWFMNGSRVASRATVLGEDGNPTFIGPPFSIAGTNGPNRDGTADILWHNSSTGEIQHWFMNGSRVASRATVLGEDGKPTFIGPPWSIVGTGNFDADPTPDILWHNSSTGEIQIWFMNGAGGTASVARRATVLGEDGKPTFIGPPFSIVGTTDFNRDGTTDILWYNSSTGEIQIWFMNGFQVASRATVLGQDGNPTYIGPPWSIFGAATFATQLPWPDGPQLV